MRDAVYTLPNLLTATRLLLAPVVVWFLLQRDMDMAFWVFVAAGVTDLLDGNLARWLDQRSVLGAWLDPIADKVMLLSTLFALTLDGLLPLWLAAIVAVRDGVILSGAAAYRHLTGGLEVAPTWLGKSAIFLEYVLVSLVLAQAALALGLDDTVPPLITMAAALSAASGLQYIWLWARKTRAYLRRET